MTLTPTNVVDTANKVVEKLTNADIEAQVFFSETGAAILTDRATYEVYTYGSDVIVQMLVAEPGRGWDDVTEILAIL